MKLPWPLPFASLILFGAFFFFSKYEAAKTIFPNSAESRTLPSRQQQEKLGRAKISSSSSITKPDPNLPAKGTIASASETVTPMRLIIPRFSDRFYFPPPAERESYIQSAFARTSKVLEQSRHWTMKLNISSRGKNIPATLILNLYDSMDRNSDYPLRSVPKPEFIAWVVVGYFQKDSRDGAIKRNVSSRIENLARLKNDFYVFLTFADDDELKENFDYLAIPLPAQESAVIQLLLPSGQWTTLPRTNWFPLEESAYRDLLSNLDRNTKF